MLDAMAPLWHARVPRPAWCAIPPPGRIALLWLLLAATPFLAAEAAEKKPAEAVGKKPAEAVEKKGVTKPEKKDAKKSAQKDAEATATTPTAMPMEIPLAAPASTLVPVLGPVPAGGVIVRAEVTVPSDAPDDLGVGAWAGDRHGTWAGRPYGRLPPGHHHLVINLAADAPAEGPAGWGPWAAAGVAKAGLFLWSASHSRVRVTVHQLTVEAAPAPAASAARVVDLAWPAQATTGHRWEATFRVAPEPADPFDPHAVDGVLTITRPDGAVERRVAFWDQPMCDRDRGDAEEVVPAGPGHFALRWRPRMPGVHRLHLTVTAGGTTRDADLPDLDVQGAAWDAYARPDPHDTRFLRVEDRFYWPVGINLHSVNDPRAVSSMHARALPERGSRAYAAYLDRFAAAGADAAEVWMSSWNLALEWTPAWDGYHGPGRYHLGRAWQLDRLLDHAESLGQRVVLVLHNHGQGSSRTDREWHLHPYNTANGGFLDDAALLFTDPRALAYQDRLHRYLVARYGDSPALLAWKLWSEVNLTDGSRQWEDVAAWHQRTAAFIAAQDTYQHPITTHFAGDWHAVNAHVVSQPAITMIAIDAYHSEAANNFDRTLATSLAQAVAPSRTAAPPRSLLRHQKPVLATEYGGSWSGGEEQAVLADLRHGPWVAFVTGHAGAPMLWWASWVDQRGYFASYGAIRAFITGEDLRGADASTMRLTTPPHLWCSAWVRPGRILGYVLAKDFANQGHEEPLDGGTVEIGTDVKAGPMQLAWWDADHGTVLASSVVEHTGGRLTLTLPAARGHVAFKLWRPAVP